MGNFATDGEKFALIFCLEKGFFDYKINYDVSEFKAVKGTESIFDIDGVMKKKFVDVGGGIMISEPVFIENRLNVGESNIYASLPHRGILAVY